MDEQTNSGRRVDGVIQPVAPYVAGHQNDFQYYAYSAIANVLDISAATFPVSSGFSLGEMAAEKESDEPIRGEEDERVQNNCG
jgi:amidase